MVSPTCGSAQPATAPTTNVNAIDSLFMAMSPGLCLTDDYPGRDTPPRTVIRRILWNPGAVPWRTQITRSSVSGVPSFVARLRFAGQEGIIHEAAGREGVLGSGGGLRGGVR